MVEIFNGIDKWGTICQIRHYFAEFELASATCKQLGYTDALAATSVALDHNEKINILLSQVFCPGDATSLNDDRCIFEEVTICHCNDRKMFGVICTGKYL